MERLAILASGNGSNAVALMEYFHGHPEAQVTGVYSNNKDAPVLDKFKQKGLKAKHFTKNDELRKFLKDDKVTMVILAGYLKLIPSKLISDFPERIINIHPSLLPKFGGKGMYGMHVHNAVKRANESVTGITIHYVNDAFDEGKIIFQESVELLSSDTPAIIAAKVQQLEHTYFAKTIENLIS